MQRGERDEQSVDLLAVSGGVLCEFLEVAFHLILYVREVYPPVVFERRKKYNVPVQMCCHPDLNQYIFDVLQTTKPLLEKGEVQRVALVISNKKLIPLERFVFEIGNPEGVSASEDNFLLHTEKALRGFLLKINACDALLEPIPPGCTFSILVYTKESSFLKLQEDRKVQEFPWVQADEGNILKDSIMIPLKSTTTGIVKMQLFVEECAHKMEKSGDKIESK
ncbi:MAD2 mitotic arrest deficient-like 2 [Desmophyllum pertusum]|uniref:Mitotic spindle assembly checkpoint protein MAD2B n=1 Tax=Desmophyllum pertusum TaxID=174260 RepID=A0A9X0A412_9CNID|nr:MAD2 mitotic arrest deficient-like 2 [Desmophyllum pertusum]